MLIRNPNNPIITRKDIISELPELNDVSSVFNPGAIVIDGETHLLLRVQNRGRETCLVHAVSRDGINFSIDEDIVKVHGLEDHFEKIYHVYDPRITMVEDKLLVVLAVDIETGCKLVIAEMKDWQNWQVVGGVFDVDTRNGVLFPEKIDGHYHLLDRPNLKLSSSEPASGEKIRLLKSTSLNDWTEVGYLLEGRPHYWDERIGSGPPPIKTHEGWLLIYHGVATHFGSSNIYQAGAFLLHLNNPAKVLGRTRYNILEPREMYELVGQVPNVVFPTGLTVDEIDEAGFSMPDSVVSLYYGAADTVIGLATTTIGELLGACRTVN
ncbi:glycoside hydrolase family 130 protein [bacterium]|nr:glycoside hydrolase family 130 protein [bacterium]